MIGTCVIDFYINSLIGAEIEKKWTDSFEVVIEKVIKEENNTNDNNINEEITEQDISEQKQKKSNNKQQNGVSLTKLNTIMLIDFLRHVLLQGK